MENGIPVVSEVEPWKMENGREGPQFGMRDFLAIALIVCLCLEFRLHRLNQQGLVLDELLHTEILAGKGSVHLRLPRDVLINAPDMFSPVGPWWRIWSRVGMNHPPLHFILLRWWMDLFGGADLSLRLFSVMASSLSAVVLYDAARLKNGRATAICASLLMAVALPQIVYGRQILDYAQLMFFGLIAVDLFVRIELKGASWRRIAGLALASLSMLLTHYFAVFGIGALFGYSLLELGGEQRRRVIGCFFCVVVVFAIIWGPFMWQQRRLFSLDDDNVLFLINRGPGRVGLSLQEAIAAPSTLLYYAKSTASYASMGMAVLYVLPFLLGRRDILFWGVWFCGIVLPLLALDIVRQSNHLGYVRYYMLAGPAVYVIIPAIFARAPWGLRYVITGALMLTCVSHAWNIYHPIDSDLRLFSSVMGSRMDAQDVCVFMAPGRNYWRAGVQYMMLERYLPQVPCRVIVATAPLRGDLFDALHRCRYIFAFTPGGSDLKDFLPGFKVIDARFYLGGGMIYQLTPNIKGRH